MCAPNADSSENSSKQRARSVRRRNALFRSEPVVMWSNKLVLLTKSIKRECFVWLLLKYLAVA